MAEEPVQIRTVRSVQHAIALLRTLAESGRPVPLSDLARRMGLSKASVYHLMRTLELERFVTRNNDGYRLSWGIYELGAAVTRSVDLTRVARMHLDRLAETTGEAILLGIAEGRSVLYLDRGQSAKGFTMVANIGRRAPLHTNASGKLLLAHMPPHIIEAVLSEGLAAKTQWTVTDPRVLRAELVSIRAAGVATCWQEQEVGLSSIAVALHDYTGDVCGALTLAGPASRVTRRSVKRLGSVLQDEAVHISETLGYRASSIGRCNTGLME